VLRLKEREGLEVCDGEGRIVKAVLAGMSAKNRAWVRVEGPLQKVMLLPTFPHSFLHKVFCRASYTNLSAQLPTQKFPAKFPARSLLQKFSCPQFLHKFFARVPTQSFCTFPYPKLLRNFCTKSLARSFLDSFLHRICFAWSSNNSKKHTKGCIYTYVNCQSGKPARRHIKRWVTGQM
jgi:hypothetical protein